jgi:hypothetical protein
MTAGDARRGPRHLANFYLAEYYREVCDLALALAAPRLSPRRQICGDRRQPPAALLGATGGAMLGGVAVPGTRMRSPPSSSTTMVIAEDQKVDKILSIKLQLPRLGVMVYDDPRGLRFYTAPCLKLLTRSSRRSRSTRWR